jgi:hypothetical protein
MQRADGGIEVYIARADRGGHALTPITRFQRCIPSLARARRMFVVAGRTDVLWNEGWRRRGAAN